MNAAAVRLGSDVLITAGALRGKRVGVVCNHASLDRGFRHVIDRVAAQTGSRWRPSSVRSTASGPTCRTTWWKRPTATIARHRVPLYSLYSETREPTAEMLAGIDVLLIDLQDIGARIYTYIYTMANCLRAAARHGVSVIVCDRPNPIGGASGRRASSSGVVRVVCRALPDSDAPRDDDR